MINKITIITLNQNQEPVEQEEHDPEGAIEDPEGLTEGLTEGLSEVRFSIFI